MCVNGETVFLFRMSLLICKAHVNAQAVTCHSGGVGTTSDGLLRWRNWKATLVLLGFLAGGCEAEVACYLLPLPVFTSFI